MSGTARTRNPSLQSLLLFYSFLIPSSPATGAFPVAAAISWLQQLLSLAANGGMQHSRDGGSGSNPRRQQLAAGAQQRQPHSSNDSAWQCRGDGGNTAAAAASRESARLGLDCPSPVLLSTCVHARAYARHGPAHASLLFPLLISPYFFSSPSSTRDGALHTCVLLLTIWPPLLQILF